MKSLRLNRKLVLETPQRDEDGAGGYTQSWLALGQLWANIESRDGREAGIGAATVSRATHKITVRASPLGSPARPNASQRFREGPRVFRILSVREINTVGRFLVCHAIEEEAV
jgi:SPP1 family predicted phage head-tail adaptor